jgi:hypothetical protein
MKNAPSVEIKSRHLPLFALLWQSWKLLDTGSGIIFKATVVSFAFFLFGVALSQGPLVNKEAKIRMRAEDECIARGLSDLSNNRYSIYRLCQAYAIRYAQEATSYPETKIIY